MKRILLPLTFIAALLLSLAPRTHAQDDVSLDIFYDNLSAQGNWIEVGDYGYCFQPNVAAEDPNWRPYSDGYWAYTDYGWTWVSYEDFGWATYHYGRWTRLEDYGWVWVPGYEWAPAWVSWRTGGDYIGWAPLPPEPNGVYEGRAIGSQADVEFDIGPQYYNFVDIRYIGAPVLRDRIFAPERNVTIISNTVNITNITYNNSTVYNYGPDYNRLQRYSTTPIQRLSIQRQSTANLAGQAGHNFNRVKGNQLMVVAPTIKKSTTVAPPKQVKAKVAKPTFEHGWQGVSNRPQIEAQMKKQNPKNIPPPTFQPQKGRNASAGAPMENRTPAPNENPNANRPNNNAAAQKAEQERAAEENRERKNKPAVTPAPENTNPPRDRAGEEKNSQEQRLSEQNQERKAREAQEAQRAEQERKRADQQKEHASRPAETPLFPQAKAPVEQQHRPAPNNANERTQERRKKKENEQTPAPTP